MKRKKKNNSNAALFRAKVVSEEKSSEVGDVVTKLVISYSTTYNILSVDKIIKKYLEKPRNSDDSYMKEIKEINQLIETSYSVPTITELKLYRDKLEIERLKEKENKIFTNYIRETESYILTYQKLPLRNTKINAMNFEQERYTKEDRQMEQIVDNYLSIASRYYPLDIKKERKKLRVLECSSCGVSLHNIKAMSNGVRICPNPLCQSENKISRAIAAPPKEYFTCDNFEKALDRAMGTAPVRFNITTMMVELDAYFKGRRKFEGTTNHEVYQSGEYYRSLPHDEYGRKEGTSHEELCIALDVLGYKDFYKDYMYIGHHYYGWNYLPIEQYYDKIMENYKIKQEIWERMPVWERGGQSTLCNEYRLCRECQEVGIPNIHLGLFRVSNRQEKIDDYDQRYTILCKKAGIKFPYPNYS